MSQQNRDVSNDTAQDLSSKTGDAAKRGVNKATRKVQQAGKKALKLAMKKALKIGAKLAIKAAMLMAKILLKLLLILWPFLLAALALWLIFLLVSAVVVDDQVESKAKNDNYQTESIEEDNEFILDPETGAYEIKTRSNGNKLFKTFYGYVAQKGYWKVVVDEDGEPETGLYRGDTKKAREIVDHYNREKDFIINSDLLYLLDIELNAKTNNDFFFPEQFIQPLAVDDEFNLKELVNEEGDIVVESTKYDEDGQATDEKVEGIWDYGFGTILQYQKFVEQREKRATLTTTYRWNYEKKKLEKVELGEGEGKEIKEGVQGYPRDTHLIKKATIPVGTIENTIVHEWMRTQEPWTKTETITIPAEKEVEYTDVEHVRNEEGKKLYYFFEPHLLINEENYTTTLLTPWPVWREVQKTKWVPTTMEIEQVYKGFVWEKIPRYEGEPDTEGIVGDQYFYDYLTNYEAYIPDVVMENFDVEERTGRDIEELEEMFKQQEAVENVESEYDENPEEERDGDYQPVEPGNEIDIGQVTGSQEKYNRAAKFMHLYEIYGNRYGVDPNLLLAIAAQESGGNDYIDHSRYGKYGVGLMQVVASTGKGGISATNLETGERDTLKLHSASDHTAEKTIQFAAMYMQYLGEFFDGNVLMALKAYNAGEGNVQKAVERYAESTGMTKQEVLQNQGDLGWDTGYPSAVDSEYLDHVLQYYANPTGGTPWLIDRQGTKYSTDGTVKTGAGIVPGASSNGNWFSKFVTVVGGAWGDLFEETPIDTLNNKEDYKWTHYKNRMTEAQYREFMRLYTSFADNVYFSETEELTLEDWKQRYKRLFENPPQASGGMQEQMIAEYDELMSRFGDDLEGPLEKFKSISQFYNGTMIKLESASNQEVMAMSSGEIAYVDSSDGVVEITSETGITIKYTNVKSISVDEGDSVSTGDVIAKTSGDLGLSFRSAEKDHIDPTPFFSLYVDGDQVYDLNRVLELFKSVEGYPYKMVGDANKKESGYFDCSGLMQWAFGEVGIKLPRTADEQFRASNVKIISENQAMPGDLIFFEGTYNTSKQVTHVGVYLGNGNFWNAQGRGVRIASLTEGGGYWGKFTRHFGRIVR